MLIFSPHISPRLHYITQEVFFHRWGIAIDFTAEQQEFEQYSGPKINYSKQAIGGFQITPSGFLEETTHRLFNPDVQHWNGSTVLFSVEKDNSVIPFDVLSMAFFLLSRYEEYNSLYTDEHGRFMAEESIAFKTNNLHRPWLDEVLIAVQAEINKIYPALNFREPQYRFQPTFDIDMLRSFEGKPLWRILTGGIREMLSGEIIRSKKRLEVLLGKSTDPNDSFEYIHQHTKNLHPIFFWLLSDYTDMDKNLYWQHPLMKYTINQCTTYGTVGIHPSYYSSVKFELFQEEAERLEQLTDADVQHSRQHFLRFSLPHTFQQLIEAGIKHEYSMGYASHTGFRASTAHPFYFYDLVKEEKTDLLLHPFVVMDVTLRHYLELSPQAARQHISELIASVKAVNGQFVSLWHNDSLSEFDEWTGWRAVFEHLLQEAKHD